MAIGNVNPYGVQPNIAPFGDGVGFYPAPPTVGSVGDPWGSQSASYGAPGPIGLRALQGMEGNLQMGIQRGTYEYKGLPDNRSVYYDVASPMLYMRSTGPEPARPSENISGPVQPMYFPNL